MLGTHQAAPKACKWLRSVRARLRPASTGPIRTIVVATMLALVWGGDCPAQESEQGGDRRLNVVFKSPSGEVQDGGVAIIHFRGARLNGFRCVPPNSP